MSSSSIPRELRRAVGARDQDRCRYCKLAQFGQAATFHVDHIIPRSLGGPTSIENLALQCPYCSLRKSNSVAAIDPETSASEPLFHPLREAWAEHFQSNADGTVQGTTPTGRATAAALGMNDPLPVLARRIQAAIGVWP